MIRNGALRPRTRGVGAALSGVALCTLAVACATDSGRSATPPVAASVPAPAPAPVTAPVPAPSAGAAGSAAGSATSAAQTPQERRAVAERKLDDSLGSFDRELASERERVAKERDARTAAGSAADAPGASDAASRAGDGATADNSSASTAAGTAVDSLPPNSQRAGDLKSERSARGAQDKEAAAAGSASGSANGAAGRNIPDGSDDDIIARRLRKAAEQETDPELKERLWQEYIEYKRSGQNKG